MTSHESNYRAARCIMWKFSSLRSVCLYKKRTRREIFTARACEKHELVAAANYTFTRRNNRVRAPARRIPSHCPDYFAPLRESRAHSASTKRPFLPPPPSPPPVLFFPNTFNHRHVSDTPGRVRVLRANATKNTPVTTRLGKDRSDTLSSHQEPLKIHAQLLCHLDADAPARENKSQSQ